MLLSKELSKASVSREILQALGRQSYATPYRILPSDEVDFLIVSERSVVGVEIALGSPGSPLPFTALGRLERASYLIRVQFPDRGVSLALLTNLAVSDRFRQVLDELGVQLFSKPHLRPNAAAVAGLIASEQPCGRLTLRPNPTPG